MSRVLASLCPSCGAQVRFTADSTVIAVCAYCATTVLRKGEAIENLGRMAELFDDHSPLQLGARGTFDGSAFVLVGRLQYRHAQGTWNEWWARLDDDRSLWLSEDNGQYVVTSPVAAQTVPRFDELGPGQPLRLMGVDYMVANRTRATVIAGRGELPFVVGSGYAAEVVDLRDARGGFATLDYSDYLVGADEGPIQAMLYVGRAVTLDALKLDGLRETLERTVATEPFSCPACGAPVQASLSSTRAITCAACASVIDLSAGVGGRLEFVRQAARVKPTIAVGSTGRLDGTTWTVVGFQRRRGEVDDESFEWDEYLLHESNQGFRFLIHDRGHWSFAQVLQRHVATRQGPGLRPVAVLDGVEFDHFAGYRAGVGYVEGEFYWQVRQGDTTVNAEFVAPPRGLSRETSGDEVTWTEARYLPSEEVARAFGLKQLDPPIGFGMLQPLSADRWRSRYGAMALAVIGALIALQVVLFATGSQRRVVAERPLNLSDPLGAEHLVDIDGTREANLVVETEGSVRNDWYEFEVEVADRNRPGEVRQASQEIAYYEGTDADGAWTEGGTRERLVFKLPPGQYLVRVSGQRNPESRQQTVASYSISRSTRPSWLPFWIGLGFLLVFNLVGYFGSPDPEARRWSDSLYGRAPAKRRRRSLGAAPKAG
ncbi:MAG: DUF4178 domain-containing protein [Burkholderiaceae bacterium]